MLIGRTELEEMTGYSIKELNVALFETSSEFYEYDIDRFDLIALFKKVKELSKCNSCDKCIHLNKEAEECISCSRQYVDRFEVKEK